METRGDEVAGSDEIASIRPSQHKERVPLSDLVRSEQRGAVCLLTLDRPDALNALNRAVLSALLERAESVAADPGIRALVLTGEGRAFAAGADIAEMRGLSATEALAFSRLGHEVGAALEALDKVTDDEIPDVLLDEAAAIVADMSQLAVAALARNHPPAQTQTD